MGNLVVMTDSLGVTSYVYDSLHRLHHVTDPFSQTVQYGYDPVGNRTSLVYPDGRTVTYTYNSNNWLVQVEDWRAGITTYGYDEAGRPVTTTLPNGVTSHNSYDLAGWLVGLRHTAVDGSLLAAYEYTLNNVGHRTAVTETVLAPDLVNEIEAYLSENGILALEAEKGAATPGISNHAWQTQTVQTGYAGDSYARALPDTGLTLEAIDTDDSPMLSFPIYSPAAANYTVWVRGMAPDAAGDSLHLGLNDEPAASASRVTGFTDEWNWASLTMADTQPTLNLTASGAYTLNLWMREDGLRLDRVLLVTDTNYIPTDLGPAESLFQTVTETVAVGELVTTVIQYQYDGLYRLTDAGYSGGITASYRYAYDPVGNMTTYTQTITHTAGVSTTRVIRAFDDANRLQTAFDYDQGTTSYYHDANGNLVQILPPDNDPTGAEQFAYNQRNLLITASRTISGSGYMPVAAFAYDGQGRRLRQIEYGDSINGGSVITTTYANDVTGLSQVLAADDGATATFYLYGLDLISQDDNAGVRTLLADGLGSVRTEMRGSAVAAVTTYEPFGALLAQTGHEGTVYGYTGEQHDSATGLLYLRARYYNPALRLFMSKDPWPGDSHRPQTMNGWSYVDNNPLNRVDPTGRQAECPDGVCGPDATNWLMREMGQHFLYGAKIRNMKVQMLLTGLKTLTLRPVSLNTLAVEDPFATIVREFGPSWLPLGRIPLLTSENVRLNVEALGVLEFALYGLAIDYSVVQYLPKSTTCGTNGCDQFDLPNGTFRSLVTLCGHCIDSSDIGNMMFGLGGAARGYNWKSTWVSAATYNVLADWIPGGFGLSGPSLEEAFFSADGKGAIPGHAIGASHAFLNPTLFCAVINNYRPMGYNDTASLAQVSQCAACETEVVSGIGNKFGAPMEENPGSLSRLSDNASTIEELESKLHLPH